ncbi:hypothetical protein TNCV_1086291 [Trichonephila clavipes]|nr:hypothetical protein TNCV_1086291 [Trichonephila clavipes]
MSREKEMRPQLWPKAWTHVLRRHWFSSQNRGSKLLGSFPTAILLLYSATLIQPSLTDTWMDTCVMYLSSSISRTEGLMYVKSAEAQSPPVLAWRECLERRCQLRCRLCHLTVA